MIKSIRTQGVILSKIQLALLMQHQITNPREILTYTTNILNDQAFKCFLSKIKLLMLVIGLTANTKHVAKSTHGVKLTLFAQHIHGLVPSFFRIEIFKSSSVSSIMVSNASARIR